MKYLLTFLIALMSSITFGQDIDQKWQFKAIEKNDSSIIAIDAATDFLTLKNNQFEYQLTAKNNLKAKGDYILQNDLLIFYYTKPKDTIRRYRITENTDSTLVFTENTTKYSFKKDAVKTIETQTEKTTTDTIILSQGFSIDSLWRGVLGMFFLITVCYLLSASRKSIDWKLVGSGLLLQLVFALLVLKVEVIATIFDWVSKNIVQFLAFSDKGAEFLFGGLVTDMNTFGFIFAFKVLPTIVFFSAFTSLLYYLGILQKIVFVFAWVMSKTMKLSGAESLAAAANIFIGQTEAPLLVKPYLDKMTKSEILSLMVGGMATIAGGVLAAFVNFLGGDSDVEKIMFTKHLLTASIMSAPAALIIAKMLYPQIEPEKVETKLNISKDKLGTNVLDAISIGTTDGLKLAINVGAMLLVFTALMAVLNWITADLIGGPTGLNDMIASATNGQYTSLSMQYLLGNIFAPIAWLIGVASEDIIIIGQLLGEKTILNEFFAYKSLSEMKTLGTFQYQKSIIIATYALCGFANFASIGIQIGGIGVLAPSQRANLARFGIKALIGGTIAALLTATIAGMIIG